MANEFRRVKDANGVYHPVTDDNRVDLASYAKTGVHNILPITIEVLKILNQTGTWDGNVYSINGITLTCIVNKNGYVTDIIGNNATASSNITMFLCDTINVSESLVLSGCPSNGAMMTYKLLATNASGASLNLQEDYGEGANIQTNSAFRIQLRIYEGQSANGLNFKPMLRYAEDKISDYGAPALSNQELSGRVTPIPLTLDTGDSTNIAISNVFSYKMGRLVTIRAQIQIKTQISSGVDVIKCDELLNTHPYYGSALMFNSNNGNMIGLLVKQSDSKLRFQSEGNIPADYYALTYTYITNS